MSSILYTVQNLVDEVRSQLDELNPDAVDTVRDILPALNRAQDYAFDILARHYPEPILAYTTLALNGNQIEYDIPDYIYEDRVQKMEIIVPSAGTNQATYREIQRISYRDITNYESATRTNVPYYYCVIGHRIRLVPTPSGTYNARMWYLRNPERLVLPQGRITVLGAGTTNYVVVDQVGDQLTTEADQLGSYVNIISGRTGEIRGTMQIQSVNGSRVQLRSVPLRTSVLGRAITGSLADLVTPPVGSTTPAVGLDDYLSPVDGICVPYYGRPVCNFLVQYTTSELVRKLGGQAELEEKVLEKFEKQIERTWVGREISTRVKKKNSNWGIPVNRWWYQ